MFFRRKKSQEPEKKEKRIWDKVLMGAIIGGAIGSVLGATIAPKKGKETRKELEEMAKNAKGSSKIFFRRFKKMLRLGKKDKNPEEPAKKIPNEQE